MAKIVVFTLALFVLPVATQASPAMVARHDVNAGSVHHYWLSDGLNRLVFWQPSSSLRKAGKSQ